MKNTNAPHFNNNLQKGISIGFVSGLLAISLSVTGIFYRMASQDDVTTMAPNLYQVEVAKSTLISQAGQIQNSVNLLSEQTTIPWTHVALNNGRIALTNTTETYVGEFFSPTSKRPTTESDYETKANTLDSQYFRWNYGSVLLNSTGTVASNFSQAVYTIGFAWVSNVPREICYALNYSLGNGVTGSLANNYYNYSQKANLASLSPGNIAYTGLFNPIAPHKDVPPLWRFATGNPSNSWCSGDDQAAGYEPHGPFTYIIITHRSRINGK